MSLLIKTDDEQRKIWAVVLEPDTVDHQGDSISAEEIQKAAHNFMTDYVCGDAEMGLDHEETTPEVVICESYIAPSRFRAINGQAIQKGSWIVCSQILDENIWKKVKSGEFTGYSIGGVGTRVPVEE